MSIVLDASALVAALTDGGPAGVWAEQLIAEHALCAPALLWVETTNLLRRLESGARIPTPVAATAQEDLMRLPLETFPFQPFAARVWQLRHTVSSYDAWYVALAEELGFPLATLDQRLARAPGPRCRFLTPRAR